MNVCTALTVIEEMDNKIWNSVVTSFQGNVKVLESDRLILRSDNTTSQDKTLYLNFYRTNKLPHIEVSKDVRIAE